MMPLVVAQSRLVVQMAQICNMINVAQTDCSLWLLGSLTSVPRLSRLVVHGWYACDCERRLRMVLIALWKRDDALGGCTEQVGCSDGTDL